VQREWQRHSEEEGIMKKANKGKPTTTITLDPRPKGELKPLTGADHDDWSLRLMNVLRGALSGDGNTDAIGAASSGMLDMKPTDPIEGMLIAQAIAAHEAAMEMYRIGWLTTGQHLEASAKFLALAEKAARTVAMLIERLDQHRGRGQQQITVKHVTVNADQAVVADQVVSGKAKEISAAALLTSATDKPIRLIEPVRRETVLVEGGGSEEK
jgi:hypothetical protein